MRKPVRYCPAITLDVVRSHYAIDRNGSKRTAAIVIDGVL